MSVSPKLPNLLYHTEALHQKNITGKNVTVAVLDSGLAPHPDIHPSRIFAFKDLVSGKTMYYDDFSHGTHVTGIISSSRIGIAPECNIVSVKVLDKHGNTSSDTLIEGIKWILSYRQEYDIQIVNISIGGNCDKLGGESHRINFWVSKLWDTGITVCCSAGNGGPRPGTITAPGSCSCVITVGSSDGSRFSSAGPLLPYITKPELVAPGNGIISLKPNGGYTIKSGTSMSVPFISCACALLLQASPFQTNEKIKEKLMEA
ncbi:MAG: S8 family peptidase, partial [Lachnospiraceae bacterium]|nr:S8 family peptidase [Lachnospiraceae bacterium]